MTDENKTPELSPLEKAQAALEVRKAAEAQTVEVAPNPPVLTEQVAPETVPAPDPAALAAAIVSASQPQNLAPVGSDLPPLPTPPSIPIMERMHPADSLPEPAIFRSRVAGSRFMFSDGTEIFFTNGWYETSNPRHKAELDQVANKTPLIYTDAHQDGIHRAIQVARSQMKPGQQVDFGSLVNAVVSMSPAAPPNPVPSAVSQLQLASVDSGFDPEKSLVAAILQNRQNSAQSNG